MKKTTIIQVAFNACDIIFHFLFTNLRSFDTFGFANDHSREMQFEANPIEQLFVWNSRILSFISFFPLAI
jgi:hypothetical protein